MDVDNRTEPGLAPPVAELFYHYLDSLSVTKPSTAFSVKYCWKHLESTFGLIRPEAISKQLCVRYCEERHRAGASVATINRELSYLRASLKFAYRSGWITSEPTVFVPRPPRTKTDRLTIHQMRVLLAAASMPHLRIFIALTILTRLRPRELLSLKWSNVDLRRRVIEFRDVRGRPTSTRLDPIAQKWFLRAYEASKSDFVIEWGDQQVAEIKKGFQMTARRAGVICTPMTLYRSAVDLAAKSSPSIASLTEFENSFNSSEADTEVIAYVSGSVSRDVSSGCF